MSSFVRRKLEKFTSEVEWDRTPSIPSLIVPLSPAPKNSQFGIRRNETLEMDSMRLQGLMRNDMVRDSLQLEEKMIERIRWKSWMVNEGSRRIFLGVWLLLHTMVFTFGFLNYQLKDNLLNARATFGCTYAIARSAALVLYVDLAFLLLPVCRNLISKLRRGPLNGVIPFGKNITFHKAVAWSIVFLTVIHILAHMVNFIHLGIALGNTTGARIRGFFAANFATGPGLTGWFMTFILAVMVWFAMDKRKKQNFEKFWYSHHLFVGFFILWQLHGMFCMIKPDRPPYCSYQQVGVFWKYWLFGGTIYIYERILREVRARHRTFISKVILHPSKVVEIQIKKEKIVTEPGQWIYLNCPEVSYFQWHPFTLTSAPQDNFISVHIRCVGDWTNALARVLGCELPVDRIENQQTGSAVVTPPMYQVLPRLMVDGPFGSASEDVFHYEVSILVGAGIGVTPFASILKSIWYRINYPRAVSKPSRLSKVYFFWICRDWEAFEWFQSLLSAIEEQDVDNHIEIHTYLTAKVKEDDINNIVVQDIGSESDAVTRLRAPTHYGRPNWDRIFQSISEKHPITEVGVFFCGPKVLGSALHKKCNLWTSGHDDSTKFIWGKG